MIQKKWKNRIEAAKKSGHFTEIDKLKAYDINQCALGEHPDYNAIDEKKYSIRPFVENMSGLFYAFVMKNNITAAERMLKEIQTLTRKDIYQIAR